MKKPDWSPRQDLDAKATQAARKPAAWAGTNGGDEEDGRAPPRRGYLQLSFFLRTQTARLTKFFLSEPPRG